MDQSPGRTLTSRRSRRSPVFRRTSIFGAACVIGLGVLAGCGSGDEGTADTAPEPSAPASSAQSPTPTESTPTEESPTQEPQEEASPSDEPAEEESPEQAAEPVVITITDFEYDLPATVSPGAEITVVNEDDVTHTVTSEQGGAFDATAAGGGGEVTFTAPDEPGSYPFVCSFHANMTGTLVVG